MLKKRKDVLINELKSFETLEKRRYDIGLETEKNFIKVSNNSLILFKLLKDKELVIRTEVKE